MASLSFQEWQNQEFPEVGSGFINPGPARCGQTIQPEREGDLRPANAFPNLTQAIVDKCDTAKNAFNLNQNLATRRRKPWAFFQTFRGDDRDTSTNEDDINKVADRNGLIKAVYKNWIDSGGTTNWFLTRINNFYSTYGIERFFFNTFVGGDASSFDSAAAWYVFETDGDTKTIKDIDKRNAIVAQLAEVRAVYGDTIDIGIKFGSWARGSDTLLIGPTLRTDTSREYITEALISDTKYADPTQETDPLLIDSIIKWRESGVNFFSMDAASPNPWLSMFYDGPNPGGQPVGRPDRDITNINYRALQIWWVNAHREIHERCGNHWALESIGFYGDPNITPLGEEETSQLLDGFDHFTTNSLVYRKYILNQLSDADFLNYSARNPDREVFWWMQNNSSDSFNGFDQTPMFIPNRDPLPVGYQNGEPFDANNLNHLQALETTLQNWKNVNVTTVIQSNVIENMFNNNLDYGVSIMA